MQIVILAAGRGTRMQSLTDTTPKPMLSIRGVPILDYKIRALPDMISEVILVVGHNHTVIENFFGSSYAGKKITYVLQHELNGTYGALRAAQPFLSERFIVIMGDDLYDPNDYVRLARHPLSILITKLSKATVTGLVLFDTDGHLQAILEKQNAQPGDYINCAAYSLTNDIFSVEPEPLPNGELGLPQTLTKLLPLHPIKTVVASNWIGITSPEDLKYAEKHLDLFA